MVALRSDLAIRDIQHQLKLDSQRSRPLTVIFK